jgi:hypothetical protein
MSNEGEVTLSEVAREATLQRVTPATGEGALGTWRSREVIRTLSRGMTDPKLGRARE